MESLKFEANGRNFDEIKLFARRNLEKKALDKVGANLHDAKCLKLTAQHG